MKKYLHTRVLAVVVVVVVATTTSHAQPHFVKTIKHPDNGLTGLTLLYEEFGQTYSLFGGGFFCDIEESSYHARVDNNGSLIFDNTLCSYDPAQASSILINDTIYHIGNNAPIKSNFQVRRYLYGGFELIDQTSLPIGDEYVRQLVKEIRKYGSRYYIAGRGKIDSLGMIPLFYVLNADLSVDTMITVDTVFDGRISDMAMTEDSILLVMYDPKQEQVFSSPSYKVVVGYDRDYNEVVRYRSEEEYDRAATTFEYLRDGEIVYYSEEAEGNRVPYLKRVNIYTGEVVWKKVYQHRAFIPEGIGEWRFDGRNIKILSDGNLLITGRMFDSFDPPELHSDSPYFAKIDINNGDIIWERVISKDRETTSSRDEHWIGAILDVIEHDNGDLAMVGYIGSPEGNEMLFLRTDADGCLEPDCGKYIDLDEMAVSSEEVEWDGGQRNEVLVYPNPASDQIRVSLAPGGSNHHILVYDSQGVLIEELWSDTHHIDIETSRWRPGVYIIHTSTDAGHATVARVMILR